MRDENSVKISRIASALERTYSLRYFMNFQFTRILFAWFYVSKAHITLPIYSFFFMDAYLLVDLFDAFDQSEMFFFFI